MANMDHLLWTSEISQKSSQIICRRSSSLPFAGRRSPDGDRVLRDLGSRISTVAAKRRQALVEARATATHENADSAEYELGLWLEWDGLTGPAQ